MLYTSAEAAKLLRQLNEDYQSLLRDERERRSFLACMGEDIESVRPEYVYRDTQDKIDSIEKRIRKIKHAINVFNTTHKIPGFDMTVDEALVYIPQLSEKKSKLFEMRSALPKKREAATSRTTYVVDYRYANYDIEEADADYRKVSEELSAVQNGLDVLNNTEKFEID